MEKQIDLSSWKRKEIFDFSDITSDSSRIIVADAPFRMYILRVAWFAFDLFTQTADMYVNSSDIARIIITPDRIEKLFTAVYLIRMNHEQFKKIKLLCGKIYFLLINIGSAAVTVYL